MIAALYIHPKGPYPALGLDCWDESRDATVGPRVVVMEFSGDQADFVYLLLSQHWEMRNDFRVRKADDPWPDG